MEALERTKIGKYAIKGTLGRGGMGMVYLGEDERIGRSVAIKTLTEGAGNPEMLKLFYREARAGILQHPNIATIYDLGDEDGLPFIVMEYAEGKDLKRIIESGVPLSLIDKLTIIDQVCAALAYAHQREVIHRDIKPANVMVQREPTIVCKLVDFGIAKVQNAAGVSGLTGTGKHFGTLHYLAPERLRGQTGDGRVDIWATGVMLYVLLTGKLPFPGSEDAEVINRILNEPFQPLSNYLTSYPPALDTILDLALAKDQDQRFGSADEFSAYLRGVIDGLKKEQIGELFADAERLNQAQQFVQARDLLNQIVKLDPQHTQARRMLTSVNQSLSRQRRADQVRELVALAHGAMESGRFLDAQNYLDEAKKEDPENAEIAAKLEDLRLRRQRFEEVENYMTRAESLRSRGDLSGALAELQKAIKLNDQDTRVRAAYAEISRQFRVAQQQEQIRKLMGQAKTEMAAGQFTAAVEHLRQIDSIDPDHTESQKMLQAALVAQEEERRRKVLEQIHLEISQLVDAGNWERAAEFLDRALEKLPTESSLLGLKTKVALQLKKQRLKQQIDAVIAQAQETFSHSPAEALLIVQRATQELGADERLSALEATLRERLQSAEKEEIRSRYLRDAQAAIDHNEYAKAVEILESYQFEFSDAAGVGDLLELARGEVAQQQRRNRITNTAAQARTLMEGEQFAQAVKILEPVHSETGDPSLARLLADCRSQLEGMVRRTDALLERVNRLRARGAFGEAIGLLQKHPDANNRGSKVATLLGEIRSDNDRQEARTAALAAANKAAEKLEFPAAIEEIEKAQRAWGTAPELASAIKEIEGRRNEHAASIVSKAVESARASLQADEATKALSDLRAVAKHVEFAGSALEAEWRRLGAEAAKPAATKRVSAIPEIEVPTESRPKGRLAGLAVAGVVVLAAIGGSAWYFTRNAKQAPAPAASAPAITTAAQPASELPKSGTIVIQGNVGDADVFVDNSRKGFTKQDGSLQLAVDPGPHSIVFKKSGYEDSKPYPIKVAQNDQQAIRYELKAAANQPTGPVDQSGYLTIHTNAGAAVSINNSPQGTSDSQGDIVVKVQPGPVAIELTKAGYQNLTQNIDVKPGAHIEMPISMTAVVVKAADPPQALFNVSATQITQGQQATLSWSTSNASEVTIDPGVGHVDANGQTSVAPQAGITYTLTAHGNGGTVTRNITIAVAAAPKPQALPTPPPPTQVATPVVENPKPAIEAALSSFYAAFNAHDTGRMHAAWTGMSAQQQKNYEKIFKDQKDMKAAYNCSPNGLIVSGDTAEWVCKETTTIDKLPPNTIQVTYRFAKTGNGWTIADRR